MDNLTVVVPYRDGHLTIDRLLESLPRELPVIVVDDQSSTLPYAVNEAWASVRIVHMDKRGYFSGAVNRGIKECATDVLVLNQDVWLEKPGDANTWSSLQLIADNRREYALIGDGVMAHPALTGGYVQGTFMFMRRDAINQVGFLNERDYPLWGATAEWQLRTCRAGFKALPTTVVGLQHSREGNYGTAIQGALKDEPQKQNLFIRTPPAISVVITSYNYGRYLHDAVHSLIGGATSLGEFKPQSFQSFEIVIVDDASTDAESRKTAAALADPWKAIRFIQLPKNVGSAAAANAGIQAAYGKYIAMLDADDMMEPTRLEKFYRLAEQNPHRVIYDDVMCIANGKRTDHWTMPPYDFDLVLNKNPMHKGILFPKLAWKECGGYPEIMNKGREDWAFNIALGAKGWCGVHIAEPLYLYRYDGHGRNHTNTSAEWRQYFFDQLYQLFPNLYRGERPMGCCGSGGQSRGTTQSSSGRGPNAFANLVGAAGMVKLEYLLDKAGTMSFYGAKTGTRYLFGGPRKLGYVDQRDVDGFLQIYESGRSAFRVWQETVQVQVVPVETAVVGVNQSDATDIAVPDETTVAATSSDDPVAAATAIAEEIKADLTEPQTARKRTRSTRSRND